MFFAFKKPSFHGWNSIYTSPTTQQFTNDWVKQQSSLIMAIPSVIVPMSFNYLINPNHPRMQEIKVVESIPFSFDSRFFK
ncbi:RES domain-containing protein [Runella defluvii]|uniref:RES domain-containing protein n=1 Tax=Runella defluvii TaxID=370973 RepID=A0A7W5ZKX3_9BACT|nr:RES family NAD+ phosphorylase [Runella defluvii]MBB3838956.1 RES domain-containing protein [Runella defluvii]